MKVIDRVYKEERAKALPPVNSKTFRISSIGWQPRKLMMAKAQEGYEAKAIEGRGVRTFEVGKQRHDALRKALVLGGFSGDIPMTEAGEKEIRLPLGGGWEIVGHPDGILNEIEVKGTKYEMVLLEIKTVGAAGWRSVKANEIDEGYIAQASMYCHILNLKWIYFLFEKKDSQHLAEVIVPMSEQAVNQSLHDIGFTIGSIEAGKTPMQVEACSGPDYGYQMRTRKRGEMPRLSLGWRCSYCQYVQHCFPTHVRMLEGGKQVCVEELAVPDDAVVISHGVDVIPRGGWKMLDGAEEMDV